MAGVGAKSDRSRNGRPTRAVRRGWPTRRRPIAPPTLARTGSDPQNASSDASVAGNPMPAKSRADSSLPTGTVTFLFTDIEGSTKLWEAHPEEMRAALARHDALMREAIVSANGHVFKTVGDAFCAAFAMAPDAVSAALKVQTALNTEPWPEETPIKVRMALHTGTVQTRDGDYFGPPLNRVARLLPIGYGGGTGPAGTSKPHRLRTP